MMRQMPPDKAVRLFLSHLYINLVNCLFNDWVVNIFLQQRYRRDRLPSHDHDMSAERPEMDDDKTMLNIHKERKRDSRDRRMRDQDEREQDLDNSRDLNLQRFPDKKKSVKKAEGFGMAADFPSYEDKDTLKSK